MSGLVLTLLVAGALAVAFIAWVWAVLSQLDDADNRW